MMVQQFRFIEDTQRPLRHATADSIESHVASSSHNSFRNSRDDVLAHAQYITPPDEEITVESCFYLDYTDY